MADTSNSQLPTPDFELRSEEVQDILTKVPHWMIRWGTVLIFGIILMLFVISWFLKYPDIVRTEVIITTNIPPEKLVAKTSGRIQTILVKDKSEVMANTPLAIIENSANYKDVFRLKKALEEFQKSSQQSFSFDQFKSLQLGEVENAFAMFQKDYVANNLNESYHPYQVEEVAHKSENNQIKERLALLIQQKEINEQELALQRNEIARYTTLHEKGVVSSQEFESKKLNFLQAEKNYKNLLTSISQLKSSLIDNTKAIKGTAINDVKETVTLDRNLSQSFYQLKKAIKDWELAYVLQSAIQGTVSFTQVWIENQTITAGDNVFSIVPTSKSGFVGKVKAPALNSGKIKIAQKVNIRLTNYPDREFGILQGKISNISLVPDKEGNIIIDVILPQGMQTSYKKQIPFQQEMRGSAEIITEDLRLIERVLYQFRDIFKR
ncbi:HlyD family efflux transporter periplasmic adaptor subunit [Flavobacterium columnare]|uniref:HlyD family efflux transporter periplasmic adaptor subunit n=1 Tax=Flavobacterium columnare TaxID=996 RepID=A0A437UBF0_9FLAO|nr:HlyD family efflux transporter periplasmic adaptor subunit [Flavobacterium columnare]RVU90943.1 HlyD family efflux transporter periplasmic adaptor subunit [Flavobacterium columnare]